MRPISPTRPTHALLCRLLFSAALLSLSLASGRAEATCWHTHGGKGYCCSPPGGPANCRRYSADELRRQREQRERRIRKARERRERARKAYQARKWLERRRAEKRRRRREEARIRREWYRQNRERLHRLKREDPPAYRRLMAVRRRAARRREERARRRRLERMRREASRGAWSRGFGLELGVGPALGLAGGDNTYDRGRVGVGLDTTVGIYYRRDYNHRSLAFSSGSLGFAAFPVMGPLLGFLFVPKSAFLGNELGVNLVGQLTWPTRDGDRFRALLLVAPRLYVSPTVRHVGRWRRWRFNSLLGFLLPKVGLEIDTDGTTSWALEVYNLSYGVRLAEHLGLQFDAAVLLRQSHGDDDLVMGVNFRLRVFVF
jgi:hypothetical protein